MFRIDHRATEVAPNRRFLAALSCAAAVIGALLLVALRPPLPDALGHEPAGARSGMPTSATPETAAEEPAEASPFFYPIV